MCNKKSHNQRSHNCSRGTRATAGASGATDYDVGYSGAVPVREGQSGAADDATADEEDGVGVDFHDEEFVTDLDRVLRGD
ncbi:citrate synthase [Sesbania bispinosa]|nr:citrate synthase [Sesbania bispinosa]